jgi:hypothetical protein
MIKAQTAVDLMYQRAISVLPMGSVDARRRLKETYDQAKEMEKEQKIMDYEMGYINGDNQKKITGEQYYNETYESNK